MDARAVKTDQALNIRFSLSGVGLTIAWESWVRDHVERGELETVLQEYCPPFPGLFLYDSRHRPSSAPRALVDYARRMRVAWRSLRCKPIGSIQNRARIGSRSWLFSLTALRPLVRGAPGHLTGTNVE